MDWMEGPLKGYFTSSRRLSDTSTEAIELIPFDITLALTGSRVVDTVALTDAVNQWITEIFEEAVAEEDFRYDFERIGLRPLHKGIRQDSNFQIAYDAMSYWGKDSEVPSETSVAAIQLDALGEAARDALLIKLRAVEDDRGLGTAVVAARGDLNRDAKDQLGNTSDGQSLDVIIVVAIVIAVLASLLLGFALFMAWKTGKQRKDSVYREGQEDSELEGGERTGPSDYKGAAGAGDPYPDSSIISADISSSLSAYYKSGMAGGHKASKNQSGALNDAASVSSMESYGYSLDGYASSIAN